MKIEKIDDKDFRIEAIKSFHWHDSIRRWEIHFTDLINCLLCSFKRKVLPDIPEDGEESYGQILTFVRGLGFDNMITERFAGKTTVGIDEAQGNIDMIFQNIPYELTSSIYVGKAAKNSDDLNGTRQYKIEQLKMYMATLPSTIGRLKIIELAGKHTPGGIVPIEHTWQMELSPLDLANIRISIINRKNLLLDALRTGDLSRLERLRDTFTPILKTSRCVAATGFKQTSQYCKEWSNMKDIRGYWLAWINENTPLTNRLRREHREQFGTLEVS